MVRVVPRPRYKAPSHRVLDRGRHSRRASRTENPGSCPSSCDLSDRQLLRCQLCIATRSALVERIRLDTIEKIEHRVGAMIGFEQATDISFRPPYHTIVFPEARRSKIAGRGHPGSLNTIRSEIPDAMVPTPGSSPGLRLSPSLRYDDRWSRAASLERSSRLQPMTYHRALAQPYVLLGLLALPFGLCAQTPFLHRVEHPAWPSVCRLLPMKPLGQVVRALKHAVSLPESSEP